MPKVLIVDDEPAILTLLQYQVGKAGYDIVTAANGEEAVEAFRSARPDAVLLDVNLPGMDGLEVLDQIKASDASVPVLMMTAAYLGGRGVADGMHSVQVAVKALTRGAYDYILKPADEFIEKVRLSLKNAIREKEERPQLVELKHQLELAEGRFANIVGDSPEMRDVFQATDKVLNTPATVLILGESGTGKELIARALHYNSDRKDAPLVILNCAAITESLLESELFGHEKGSFTGALNLKLGKFEAADGGTIFLDEIGDMPLTTQSKVLRVLQEGEVVRVGGIERIKVDVRCIAATHRYLEDMVAAGDFREDLYYRLMVYPIRLPPLRERRGDIPLLVAHFLHRHSQAVGKAVEGVTEEALDTLCRYPWPGNVRELENSLLRAVILAEGERVEVQDLSPKILGTSSGETLAQLEARAIRAALSAAGGDIEAAAESLDIGLDQIQAKAAAHGIDLGP